MAKGTRELKARIRGVTNIKQITRAMEMVATTKLRRLQERAEGAAPYAAGLQRLVATLVDSVDQGVSPLLQRRDAACRLVVVVSSERGLCGAYNSNLLRMAEAYVRSDPNVRYRVRTVGQKAMSYFRRRGIEVEHGYEEQLEKLPFARARQIMTELRSEFENGKADEVVIVATRFVSAVSQCPEVIRLLPIDGEELKAGGEGGAGNQVLPILEPSAAEIFRRLLPKFLEVRLFAALLDSVASEFAMRRIAMKAATDAAGDMIEDLRRQYNRARQETITKELLDIVGAAEALK